LSTKPSFSGAFTFSNPSQTEEMSLKEPTPTSRESHKEESELARKEKTKTRIVRYAAKFPLINGKPQFSSNAILKHSMTTLFGKDRAHVRTAEKQAKVYINAAEENNGSFTIWPESVTSLAVPDESTNQYSQLTFMARCLHAWSITGDCNTDEAEYFEFFCQRYEG
jgi:hypothetical protein